MTDRVGTFRQLVEIADDEAGPFAALDALVDTGATYSLFPRALLGRLGVTAHDRTVFELADGRTIVRELATVVARLDGRTRHILCIVGEDGAESLLGATTLELFGLAADPVNQRLVPAKLYLMRSAGFRVARYAPIQPLASRTPADRDS